MPDEKSEQRIMKSKTDILLLCLNLIPKMKSTLNRMGLLGLITASMSLYSCNEAEAPKEADSTSSEIKVPEDAQKPAEAPVQSEADLKAFLHSKEGTYGWKTNADSITYDFFQDGRLHIQGQDGEATMWEGKWELKGNQLTMTSDEKKMNETQAIQMKGDTLMIGNKVYTRYVASGQ